MFAFEHMSSQHATLIEHNRAFSNMRKKVTEISVEKKRADDKLLKLQADMEHESTTCRELKEELLRVQGDFTLDLEDKDVALRLVVERKAELEHERVTFQEEKDELQRDFGTGSY